MTFRVICLAMVNRFFQIQYFTCFVWNKATLVNQHKLNICAPNCCNCITVHISAVY